MLKLSTAALRKSLDWEEKDIRVVGRLRFADDEDVLSSNSTPGTEATLTELNEAAKTIGLQNNQRMIQFTKKV